MNQKFKEILDGMKNGTQESNALDVKSSPRDKPGKLLMLELKA